MDRRSFLWTTTLGTCALASSLTGCRGRQTAHVLDDSQQDMVGSHAAGAETYNQLIDEAVARLLERQSQPFAQAGHVEGLSPKRICFIGVENKSVEEMGDFKEQVYELIDTAIEHSETFQPISYRYVKAGLDQCHMRPEQIMSPDGMGNFQTAMAQQGQPFDYLLYAKLTSGTTYKNTSDKQRDYLLTLELVNVHTGDYDKESAKVRKGYHKSTIGKWMNYNPFTKR